MLCQNTGSLRFANLCTSLICSRLANIWQPKYWCKHCKTFVRDTKLEKTNHEATPKHQGNLKRFLRDLHRGHEREERDAQRAKDEVARLNAVVSGSSSAAASQGGAPWRRKPIVESANSTMRQATPADRKQQLKQLAEMGVAIPEEFRREMAMAGDWQTLSQRAVLDDVKQEEDSKESKSEILNRGVRKRRYEGQEEDEEAEAKLAKKAWGSTTRIYPSIGGDGDDGLDSLLQNTTVVKREGGEPIEGLRSKNLPVTQIPEKLGMPKTQDGLFAQVPLIKKEDSENSGIPPIDVPGVNSVEDSAVKTENEASDTGIVFKKRKAKQIRQR